MRGRYSLAASWIAVMGMSSMTHCFQTPMVRPLSISSRGIDYGCGWWGRVGSELHSISSLVEDLTSEDGKKKTVFVGGKGGVGKTSISSALAVTLASDFLKDTKVLVVSTDPAHSLGDALDVDLKGVTPGAPIQMTDPLTMGKLYACEVDPEAALDSFRDALEAFDIQTLSESLGVSVEMLQGFGLQDVSTLLNNPPPGLDELVALSNVLDSDTVAGDFDVIVVDTAPTGHTLRMLALPQFLDGFLIKILELRQKLSGLANTLQAFLGNNNDAAQQRAQTVDDAISKLMEFQQKMTKLRNRLSNPDETNFVVVSIPTKLSVNESKRLITDLQSQGISITNLIMNQCITNTEETSSSSEEAMVQYYQRRQAGQQKWITTLQTSIDDVSQSQEYQSNHGGSIQLTKVPFLDVELIGVPALAYIGRSTFIDNPHYQYLLQPPDTNNNEGKKDCQFIICGGKGGVGKTTTSSSLAVTMAAEGNNVALISTDPAHSLGDAFDMDFRGGNLVDVPLIGVPPTDGSLQVMEIDPAMALGQFKGLVDDLVGKTGNTDDSSNGGIGKTLRDLGEIFDTLPAGTDEVVALAKVVKLVKEGNFDRIVLDTAPTGHTLRMLSTPSFIADLIDKLLAIAQKLNSNSMVKMLMAGATGGNGEEMEAAAVAAKSALLSFQFQMYDLEDLFANPDQTEFLIVTIPTELAVRESIRLLNDLTYEAPDMPIKVRNVVVNQVLNEDGDDIQSFVERVAKSQKHSIDDLRNAAATMTQPPTITEVPYLDTEPRGVFGLKALSMELVKEDQLQQ